jgi:hypothetical protein
MVKLRQIRPYCGLFILSRSLHVALMTFLLAHWEFVVGHGFQESKSLTFLSCWDWFYKIYVRFFNIKLNMNSIYI